MRERSIFPSLFASAIPAAFCAVALSLPAGAQDKARDDGADNMFSIDDEVCPSFTSASDRSLERILGREIQSPSMQQLRCVPSLTREQRVQIQSICDGCKPEHSKIIDEIKSLRRTAEERKKTSEATKQASSVTRLSSIAHSAVAENSPSTPSRSRIETVSAGSAEFRAHRFNNHKSKNKSFHPAQLPSSTTEPAQKSSTGNSAPLLETILVFLTADERAKLNGLCSQLIGRNREAVDQIDAVLTEQNRSEWRLMQQGLLLPNFLTGSFTTVSGSAAEHSSDMSPAPGSPKERGW